MTRFGPNDKVAPMRGRVVLVASLLFGSGFSALVYQTAWQRQCQLIFGASTEASAAVLGIFLGGLGLGGLLLGKYAERSRRPLFVYGNLELGVALSAGLSPLLLDLLGRGYLALGGSLQLGTALATAVRLLIAALALGPSVFLMGGTLPAAARAVETNEDQARSRLALLYGLNTCGAVVGAFMGTFALFEVFGTHATLWIACLLNLLVAVSARAAARRWPEVESDEETPEFGTVPSEGAVPAGFVYGVAGAVGFAFLLLELVWYRMLAPILGGSTFTFGLILAVALAGIGLGGYLYSRRPEGEPATLALLAGTAALEGAFVALPLYLGDTIAIYAANTRAMMSVGFSGLVASWLAVTSLVVFPAALVSGYQFPLLLALLGRGRTNVALHVGRLYAFNTAGAILGSIVGGLMLIPWLGSVACWRLVSATLLVIAVAALALVLLRPPRPLVSAVGVGVLLVLGTSFAVAQGPTAAWRHSPIGAGRTHLQKLSRNELRAWRARVRANTVWEADGIESAVAVNDAEGVAFLVNGKADGSVFLDRGTQTMLGLLPALLHPEPKNAFVVGLGTGMTAGWLAAVDTMQRVDVAELEPEIRHVAELSAPFNHDVLNNDKVHLFWGDGREFMLTTERTYDLIVSEPSNPYRSGIASLFTREFYEAARSRLREGGFFAQWLQAYEVDGRSLRMVFRTLRSVFPFVEAWQTESGDLVLLASLAEQNYDAAELRKKIATEPFESALTYTWLVQDLEGVLAYFIADDQALQQASQYLDPPVNSDDLNFLEYAFARSVGQRQRDNSEALAWGVSSAQTRPRLRGDVDWARVDELRGRGYLQTAERAPRPFSKDEAANKRAYAVASACAGHPKNAWRVWHAQPRGPRDDIERYALAVAAGFDGADEAGVRARDLLDDGYVAEGHLVLGMAASRAGNRAQAVDQFIQGLRALRAPPFPLCSTSTLLIDGLFKVARREPELAARAAAALLEGPLAARLDEVRRVVTAQKLAFVAARAAERFVPLCLKALGEQLEDPFWRQDFLENRLMCLTKAGHPAQTAAEEDLVEFLSATAGQVLPPNESAPKVQPARVPPAKVSTDVPSREAGAPPPEPRSVPE